MNFPAVVRGEELPPVALCPDQRMVAVLESIGARDPPPICGV
jgi:hypothetical protein